MKLKKEMIGIVAGAAMFASSAHAEIPLTDDLSAYGYIDLAYTDLDDGEKPSKEVLLNSSLVLHSLLKIANGLRLQSFPSWELVISVAVKMSTHSGKP